MGGTAFTESAGLTGEAGGLAAAAFAEAAFANSTLASATFLAAFFAATAFIAARFCAEFSAAAFAAAAFAAAAALPFAFSGAFDGILDGILDGVLEEFLGEVLGLAALGATFAVLFGISLLFLEAAAGVPLRPGALTGKRARPVAAAWRAEAACFETLRALSAEILLEAALPEIFLPEVFVPVDLPVDLPEDLDELLLRVFCGTTIAQNRRAPVC